MHEIVRSRLQHNIDYHEAVADYYTKMQSGGAETAATPADPNAPPGIPLAPPPIEPPPSSPPPPTANTGSRARRAAAAEAVATAVRDRRADDLAVLVEMHAGAAQQLRDLLAADPPQAISGSRPPITRQTGPVRSSRVFH